MYRPLVCDGAGNTVFAQQLLREATNDVIYVLSKQEGHVSSTAFDAIPVLFAYPIIEGAAWNAEHFSDLGLGEIGLKVQSFGLDLLQIIHRKSILGRQS